MLLDEKYCLIAGPLLQVSRFHRFPYVTVGAQNRSFQKQWLNEFTWLAYSNIYNRAFCIWCVVFAPETVSRSTKPPGSLVSGPHCNAFIKRQRNITIITKTVTIIMRSSGPSPGFSSRGGQKPERGPQF